MFQRGVKRTDCAHRAPRVAAKHRRTDIHSLTSLTRDPPKPFVYLALLWYCTGVDRDLQATFKTENNVDITSDAVEYLQRDFEDQVRCVLNVPCFALIVCYRSSSLWVHLADTTRAERAPYVSHSTENRRRGGSDTSIGGCRAAEKVFSAILGNVKGLGEGSERGASSYSLLSPPTLLTPNYTEIEGFFNLLYAHLLTLGYLRLQAKSQ